MSGICKEAIANAQMGAPASTVICVLITGVVILIAPWIWEKTMSKR